MFGSLSFLRLSLSVADLRQNAQIFRKKKVTLERSKARDPTCLSWATLLIEIRRIFSTTCPTFIGR